MNPSARTIGPYELISELGRGGMGVVYRARHTTLGREVALKVIADGTGGTSASGIGMGSTEGAAALAARFLREAQAAGQLAGHPNIVAVHDVGDADGRLYLAMELVEGRSLDELIDEGELTTQEGARLLAQVARAAQHAHEAGVLHRDLKPANILVSADGTAHLTDFGLARPTRADADVTRLTQAGEMLGTPAYMAPEQARGTGLDARADVYALGATLYDLLCGRPPFDGDSTIRVLNGLLRDRPEPPRHHRPDCPLDLETIVLACLEKEPDDRYQSAGELADELDRFLDGRPIQRRAVGVGTRLRRTLRAHPVVAGLALLVVACAAGAGWIWSRSRIAEQQDDSKLAHTRETGSAAERAGAAAERLFALARATREPMRLLENRWHGADVPKAEVRAAVTVITEHTAGTSPALAAAWHAVALQFHEEPGDADALVAQALATSGEDPFPYLIAARVALTRYVRLAERPKVGYSKTLQVSEFHQTDAMRALLREVDDALSAAERSPLWSHIQQGREYRDYVEAAQAFGRGEWAAAATRLDALTEDDALGAEAAMLAGLGWYVAQDYRQAAASWARAGARGWPNALRYAGDAWGAETSVRLSRGEDPLPTMERAERSLAAAAATTWNRSPFLILQANARQRRTNLTLDRGGDALALIPGTIALLTEVAAFGDADLSVAFGNRGNAHLLAGSILRRRGDDPRPRWELAAADYQRALEAADGDPWPLGKRGVLYNRIASYVDEINQDAEPWYDKCVDDCSAVLAVYPDAAQVRMQRASALVPLSEKRRARGDTAGARSALQQAISDCRYAVGKRPNDYEAHLLLGSALASLAQEADTGEPQRAALYAEVFQAYQRAGELRPGDVKAHYHTAAAHRRYTELLPKGSAASLVHADAAVAAARRAVAAGPAIGGSHTALMFAHAARIHVLVHRRADITPDWIAMQRTFVDIDRLGTKHGRELLDIASICDDLIKVCTPTGLEVDQFFVAAIKACRTVTQRSPNWSRGWSKRGELRQAWGKLAEKRGGPAQERHATAEADFTHALTLAPERWAVWNNRANSRQSLGALRKRAGGDPTSYYEGAVADYTAALKIRPHLWQSMAGRGAVYATMGRTHDAIADFERVLEYQPGFTKVRDYIEELKRR